MAENFTVFIIDDDQQMRKHLRSLVKGIATEIHLFETAPEALEKYKEVKPQVVLLDLMMPQMKGDEFLIKVSENLFFGESAIFLVTAVQLSEKDQFELKTLGIKEFFFKPFDQVALVDAIRAEKENQT